MTAHVAHDRNDGAHYDDRGEEHLLRRHEEVLTVEEYPDGKEDQTLDLVDEHEEEERRRRERALPGQITKKCQSHREET